MEARQQAGDMMEEVDREASDRKSELDSSRVTSQNGRGRPPSGFDLEKVPEKEDDGEKEAGTGGTGGGHSEETGGGRDRSEGGRMFASDASDGKPTSQAGGQSARADGDQGVPEKAREDSTGAGQPTESEQGVPTESKQGVLEAREGDSPWGDSELKSKSSLEKSAVVMERVSLQEPEREKGGSAVIFIRSEVECKGPSDIIDGKLGPPESSKEGVGRSSGEEGEDSLARARKGETGEVAADKEEEAAQLEDSELREERLRGGTKAGLADPGLKKRWSRIESVGVGGNGPDQEGGTSRDFGFAYEEAQRIKKQALQYQRQMEVAYQDLDLLGSGCLLEDLANGRQLQVPGTAEVERPAERGPYQCKLCGVVFANSQALGGHMSGHRRQFLGTPPTRSDAFQLPSASTPSAHFVNVTGGSQTNCQPQSPLEAALLALDTPTTRASLPTTGPSSPSLGPLQEKGTGRGLAHAAAEVPMASEGPVLAMGTRPQLEGQLGLAGLTENRGRRGDPPQSGPPLVYIPGQGASPGAWYVLEPVDLAHPERTPQISIAASPASVAERIRKALVDHSGGPPEVNRPPTSEVHGSLVSELDEPLSLGEQAQILEQLHWQQQQQEEGVALAALAAAFQDEGPNKGGRSAAEPLAPASWGFSPSIGKHR